MLTKTGISDVHTARIEFDVWGKSSADRAESGSVRRNLPDRSQTGVSEFNGGENLNFVPIIDKL